LRPGAITPEDIARVIGRRPRVRGEAASAAAAAEAAPRVSGALAAHYAPRTPVRLLDSALLGAEAVTLAAEGSRVAVLTHSVANPHDSRLIWQAMPADAAAYAHELYANLRALDTLDADFILIESLPEAPAWRAIADRL